MPAHSVFELTVQSTTVDGEYRLVAEWARPEQLPIRREHALRIDHEELEAQRNARGYGEALGQRVFRGGVRELFAQARSSTSMLRVLLAVEAPALQTLRWERLAGPFDDDQWRLLGHDQRTPFSLYLPSGSDRRFPPFGRRELRALVVIANPTTPNRYGVRPFDEAEALDVVLEGLGEIPSLVLGKDPRAVGPPTLAEIGRRLTMERFTLLQLVSHGAFSARTGETAVFLDDEDGQTVSVKATSMLQHFKDLGAARGLPHLAFLAVCDSAKPEAEAALGGLGQRLVRELGMPAVVAMTERVSQATGLTLSKELFARLRDHGEVDRALVEACVAVRDQADATVPALFSRLAGRPLFTDALDRPMTRAELSAAVGQLDALFIERAPVLRERARVLGQAIDVDTDVLSERAAREHAGRLAQLEQLCEDALDLSLSALGHGRTPPPYAVRCPFPGLRAFTAEQRDHFHGREPLVGRLVEQLRVEPFVAVLGNSGCGKSSLVMAGVIPRLLDANPRLRVAQIEPGEHPLVVLADAQAQLEGAADALLYVDQFEEIFTLCHDEAERRSFLAELLARVGPAHRVIVSMRADFLGECAVYDGLCRRLETMELVPPMSANELRNAIEAQGKAAGLRYETGLCERILEDLEHEPGAMPLLQHVLRALYDQRHGRWLRLEAYHALGRVHEAIAKTAEGVWDTLDAWDRDRLRSVLLELTEIHEIDEGDSVRYLRRRVPLRTLYTLSIADASEERSIKRLVDLLANERLLVKSHDDRQGDVVEVAHEALLRGWERLQGWLVSAQDSLRLRQDVERAALTWHGSGQSGAYLEHMRERGERVRQFMRQGMLKLDPRLEEYLDACEVAERQQRREQERQRQEKLEAAQRLAAEQSRRVRLLWRAALGLLVVGAVAIVAAVFWSREYDRAETSAQAAEEAAKRARELAEQETLAKEAAQDARDRARDATWMTYVRHFEAVDPTRALLGLREVASTDTVRWRQDALDVLLQPVSRAILVGHGGVVISAGFSPDGQRVVTASMDGTARIWRADGREEPVVLAGHDGGVVAAVFSPDGQRVVTASQDQTARVWDVEAPTEPVILRGHGAGIESVLFSPDGTRVVTASTDETARVWRADGHGEPVVLGGHAGWVNGAAFDPGGQRVVTASQDGTARIWSASGGDPQRVLEGHERPVVSAGFSPDGQRVVTASEDATARVWTMGTGEPVVLRHDDWVVAASFSPGGERVVTASRDRTARTWEVASERAGARYEHEGPVKAAVFGPGGEVITVAEDGTVRVWSADRSSVRGMLVGHRGGVNAVSVDRGGAQVVTASDDGTARVWSLEGSGVSVPLMGGGGSVYGAVYSPDGSRVVTISYDKGVRIWRVEAPDEPIELGSHRGRVRSVRYSPEGARVVTASDDGTACVWRVDGGGAPIRLVHEGKVIAAEFSPDGARVLTVSQGAAARLWDADGGRALMELGGPDGEVLSAGFSPDGAKVVTASADGTARVWNVHDRAPPTVLRGHEGRIEWADFGPNGSKVVTASVDGMARVWDLDGGPTVILGEHEGAVKVARLGPEGTRVLTVSTGPEVRVWSLDQPGVFVPLRGHRGPIKSASFGPAGRWVVTASEDQTARVWRVDGSEAPLVLRGHEGPVVWAGFGAEGRSVLTASYDGRARVWTLDPTALRGLLEGGSTACVPVEERRLFLGERADEACMAFAECERRWGRRGQCGDDLHEKISM
ncbi:MAG: CHAT domain-containing protein [Myxococcota bacterium]